MGVDMSRGMRTNSEYVAKYAVLIPSMLDSQLRALIREFEYGQIAGMCRVELRRRAEMNAA